jgi:hypothetical protein
MKMHRPKFVIPANAGMTLCEEYARCSGARLHKRVTQPERLKQVEQDFL